MKTKKKINNVLTWTKSDSGSTVRCATNPCAFLFWSLARICALNGIWGQRVKHSEKYPSRISCIFVALKQILEFRSYEYCSIYRRTSLTESYFLSALRNCVLPKMNPFAEASREAILAFSPIYSLATIDINACVTEMDYDTTGPSMLATLFPDASSAASVLSESTYDHLLYTPTNSTSRSSSSCSTTSSGSSSTSTSSSSSTSSGSSTSSSISTDDGELRSRHLFFIFTFWVSDGIFFQQMIPAVVYKSHPAANVTNQWMREGELAATNSRKRSRRAVLLGFRKWRSPNSYDRLTTWRTTSTG